MPAQDAESLTVYQLRVQEDWRFLTGLLAAGQTTPLSISPGQAVLPLTLLTGFLGAGKTTLLSRLLAHPQGKRIVALVNDFASINIDEKLIAGRDDEILTLTNGCACCSLASDLSRKLVDLTRMPEPPDAVVLEASGLSDPHGLAQIAQTIPGIRVDGIVTLVDAIEMRSCTDDALTQELFRTQLAAADIILLNKMDLLSASERVGRLAWLSELAPGKTIIPAIQADLPTELVLGIARETPVGCNTLTADLQAFESWSITCDGLLDRDRVKAWLASLPATLLRAKGVFSFADSPQAITIYQRVGSRWQFSVNFTPSQTAESAVVFIGKKGLLDQQTLQGELLACRHGISRIAG